MAPPLLDAGALPPFSGCLISGCQASYPCFSCSFHFTAKQKLNQSLKTNLISRQLIWFEHGKKALNSSVREAVLLVLKGRLLLSLLSINLFLFPFGKSGFPVSTSDLNHKRCGFSFPEVKKKRWMDVLQLKRLWDNGLQPLSYCYCSALFNQSLIMSCPSQSQLPLSRRHAVTFGHARSHFSRRRRDTSASIALF